MEYAMQKPYFFCGQDLSDCPSKQDFVKLLSSKIAKQTGVKPVGLDAKVWDNSHAMYVISQLVIIGQNKAKADKTLNAVEQWFWDPKNQMLNFKPAK